MIQPIKDLSGEDGASEVADGLMLIPRRMFREIFFLEMILKYLPENFEKEKDIGMIPNLRSPCYGA